MTVTAVRKDPQRLTLIVEAEFDASVERIWQLWADPRKLERWWGPPTYPATFTKHNLTPGSRVEYHMTGPAGDQPRGYWDVLEVEPPRRILLRDACANSDGTPKVFNACQNSNDCGAGHSPSRSPTTTSVGVFACFINVIGELLA